MHKFLTRNKIYFETVAATSLSVMALCVTISSNKIADQQTYLMQQETLPIMHFEIELVQNEKTLEYRRERMYGYNFGAPVRGLEVRELIFLEIEAILPVNPNDATPKRVMVPIDDYFGLTLSTGNATEKLVTFESYPLDDNNYLLAKLSSEFSNYMHEHGNYGSVQVVRYVQVAYHDVLGIRHSEVYFVDEHGTIDMGSVGENIASAHDSRKLEPNKQVLLAELTPEQLFELVKTRPEAPQMYAPIKGSEDWYTRWGSNSGMH